MVDTITITIDSENDRSNETVETQFSRRLRALADHLENPAFENDLGDNIVDQDGEKIGEWQITPEEVTPFDGQLESHCSMCNHGLNHEVHYPSGNAVVNNQARG